MKKFCLVVVPFVLVGCASEPAPFAPDHVYKETAAALAASQQCVAKGKFSPEIGARTEQYAMAEISRYRYYPNILMQRVASIGEVTGEGLTQGCAYYSIKTMKKYNEVQSNNAWQAEQRQELNRTLDNINNSHPVYCTTIGGFTSCQ